MGHEQRRAQRAQDATVETSVPERDWSGWAVISTPQGWQHARVLIPESQMARFIVGEVNPPNTKAITMAKIQNDALSDRLVDRRGWVRNVEIK